MLNSENSVVSQFEIMAGWSRVVPMVQTTRTRFIEAVRFALTKALRMVRLREPFVPDEIKTAMATRIVEHIESRGYEVKAADRPAQVQPPTTVDLARRRHPVELIERGRSRRHRADRPETRAGLMRPQPYATEAAN